MEQSITAVSFEDSAEIIESGECHEECDIGHATIKRMTHPSLGPIVLVHTAGEKSAYIKI